MQNLNTNKQVAVVMATYNPNIEFFVKQIHSIKEQTYTNWECIVIDDCSSNEKFEEIKQIIAEDVRFTLHQNKVNLGSYHTFEEGLKLIANSQHEYICFCDQDDIWLPRKIEILVKEFDDLQISCVHSDLQLIDADDNLIHPSCWQFEGRNTEIYDSQLLILRNTITGCSMMFRKTVLEMALPFPKQQIKNSFHHDLWIALISLKHGVIKPIYEPLVLYRQHGNNVVGAMKSFSKRDFFHKLMSSNNPIKLIIDRSIFQIIARENIASSYNERINDKSFNYFHSKFDFAFSMILLSIKSFIKKIGVIRIMPYLIIGKFFLSISSKRNPHNRRVN